MTGYRSALASAGLRHRAEYVRYAGLDAAEARLRTHELLDLPEPPTAVFACSDRRSLGVYEALRQREARVPDDVSVVGFDDLPEARWAGPALTTVRQPLGEMAATALRLLVRMTGGERPEGIRTELSSRLVREHGRTTRGAAAFVRPRAATAGRLRVPSRRHKGSRQRRSVLFVIACGAHEGFDHVHGTAVVVAARGAAAGLDVGRAIDFQPGVGVGVVNHGDQAPGRDGGYGSGPEQGGCRGRGEGEPGYGTGHTPTPSGVSRSRAMLRSSRVVAAFTPTPPAGSTSGSRPSAAFRLPSAESIASCAANRQGVL